MTFSGYLAVLAVPSVRGVLLLSMLVRIPMFAAMIAARNVPAPELRRLETTAVAELARTSDVGAAAGA